MIFWMLPRLKIFFFVIIIIAMGNSCQFQKDILCQQQQPNFEELENKIQILYKATIEPYNSPSEGLTNFSMVQDRITPIKENQVNEMFSKTKKVAPTNWDNFVFIYNLLEGEVTFSVLTFAYLKGGKCKGLVFEDSASPKHGNIQSCDFFYKDYNLDSEVQFLNNGVLVIAKFNQCYELEEYDVLVGLGFTALEPLFEVYGNLIAD